jgi:TRAP-type C4-dicarboxylate transport system permease small subunit
LASISNHEAKREYNMSIADRLVSKRQRHLKWPALDTLELILMLLCGILLFGFCTTVIFDIITREIRHPWLWLQEVTSTFFIYAIFVGTAVAARRNDHLYLTAIADALHGRTRTAVEIATRIVVLVVALCFIYFGYLNFLRGFTSFRMPSMTPIASLYAAIPLCGVLIALFMIEQLVNGWRNGFEHEESPDELMPGHPIEAIAESIPPLKTTGDPT